MVGKMKNLGQGEKMLYVVLLCALACITIKGYSGKKVSCNIKNSKDPYVFSLIRMVFCILIGLGFVVVENSARFLLPELKMILICVLSGAANAAFLVFWMIAVRKNSMVTVDVGLTLGSLIPSVLCLLIFKEAFSVSKMIGFAFILLATFILSSSNSNKREKSFVGMALVAIAAIGDGMASFSQQLYKHFYTAEGSRVGSVVYPKTIFHLYTYVFTALILLTVIICYSIIEAKKRTKSKQNVTYERSLTAKIVLHIFIMAACLFAANYLQTVATTDYKMPSQMMYPIVRGGTLVTVNIVAMAFFGEKITKRSVSGTLVALVGIVIMSVL